MLSVSAAQPVEIVRAAPATGLADDHEPPTSQIAEAGCHGLAGRCPAMVFPLVTVTATQGLLDRADILSASGT